MHGPFVSAEETDFLRESNAIEGVYDSNSLDRAIAAWEYLKKVNTLSVKDVLRTHELLMQDQPLLPEYIGSFRPRGVEVRIGWRMGSPSETVPRAIEEWVAMMNAPLEQLTERHIDWKVLHVQYEEIHPFADGNGRTGRMFMNWCRLRHGLSLLVIWEKEKRDYYEWFNKAS